MSVVITTYNHAQFLAGALRSVANQTRQPDEVIIVDDGSTDDPRAVTDHWPGTRLIRQRNRGVSAARNTGLHAARGSYVLFLDADDLLDPLAVASGLACFATQPSAALVYGAHTFVDARTAPSGVRRFLPLQGDPFVALLRGNIIAMHAAVLYRRHPLAASGGFDERLSLAEDYDVYLRLARQHPVASHPNVAATYVWHGGNASSDHRRSLHAALAVHRAHRPSRQEGDLRRRAWREGRHNWRAHYVNVVLDEGRGGSLMPLVAWGLAARMSPPVTVKRALRKAARSGVRLLPRSLGHTVGRRVGRAVPHGGVDLGDLDSIRPISDDFGWDRGQPIDRYYIERFLGLHAGDVRGRVLEVGDSSYSARYGNGRITTQDILHVDSGHPDATIVGDISQPGVLPWNTFDCIILTQTLQYVYDLRAAIRELHGALKPGGALLLTVPGISPIDHGEWKTTRYWSLTQSSALRLLGEHFPVQSTTIEGHGNVFAATMFLQGLSVEEVDTSKLDARDDAYPVVLTIRVTKAPAAT